MKYSAPKIQLISAVAILIATMMVLILANAISHSTPDASSPGLAVEEDPANRGGSDVSAGSANWRVEYANEDNFRSLVLDSPDTVLVDFYADWCVPCQRIGPLLQKLTAEMPNVKVVKVDVDSNPNLSRQYDVQAIPNIKVFENGVVVAEIVGLVSIGELRRMLSRSRSARKSPATTDARRPY
ncbi:MAG: hypothetical protein JW959_06465 [Pirellulales bacterium]|nr:hypothetical protein [Pirellulales bacterium]